MKDEILFQDWYNEFLAWLQSQEEEEEEEEEEENSVNHEDEYLTSLKNYDIINM